MASVETTKKILKEGPQVEVYVPRPKKGKGITHLCAARINKVEWWVKYGEKQMVPLPVAVLMWNRGLTGGPPPKGAGIKPRVKYGPPSPQLSIHPDPELRKPVGAGAVPEGLFQ